MILAIFSSSSCVSAASSASGSSALRNGNADGRAHLAFLRAVRFVDQERHAQFLQFRVLLDLLQHPGELLLGRDDDRLALLEEARQVVRLPRQTHHVLQVRELLDVLPDVRVERLAVGEDEDDIHQLLARAGLEEAVQPVGQPADGERLAAAGGMIDQVLAPDVAGRGEVRRDVVGHLAHHAALVVAREDGERRSLRLVLLGLALGHADEKERQRLQQLVLRQHLAVEELDRVFVQSVCGVVGQPGVVPAEVLLPARVGRRHHVAGVGGEVEERMLEDPAGMVAGRELRHGVMHVLVLLVLHLQRHDGQAVEEEDEIDLLVGLAEVEVRAEGDAILAVLLRGGALGGAGLRVDRAGTPARAPCRPWRRIIQSGVCSSSLRSALNTSSRASVP